MKQVFVYALIFVALQVSCNKSTRSEGEPGNDSGVNLAEKTPTKTSDASRPVAGTLIIDAGLAAGTERVNSTEHSLSLATTAQEPANVANLCKSCTDLRKELSNFQKNTQKATLEASLKTLLGSLKLCTDLKSLQNLQEGIEKQIDAFNSEASTNSDTEASSTVDFVNAANDLRDKIRSHTSQLEPVRSDASIINSMKKNCP